MVLRLKRPALAIILLVAGVFLMLEGSKLYASSFWTDLAMLVVGIVLTISYLPLIGDSLKKSFGGNPSTTYIPILVALGAGLLWQAGFRILALTDRVAFAIIGATMVVVSAIYLRRAMKSRSK